MVGCRKHRIPILILLFFHRVDGCPTSSCLWEFKMRLQIFITWRLANLRGFEIRQALNHTRRNMTSTQVQQRKCAKPMQHDTKTEIVQVVGKVNTIFNFLKSKISQLCDTTLLYYYSISFESKTWFILSPPTGTRGISSYPQVPQKNFILPHYHIKRTLLHRKEKSGCDVSLTSRQGLVSRKSSMQLQHNGGRNLKSPSLRAFKSFLRIWTVSVVWWGGKKSPLPERWYKSVCTTGLCLPPAQ